MNTSVQQMFSNFTGSGIRIGIIDSGYCPGRKLRNAHRGINVMGAGGYTSDNTGLEDDVDRIGHGTACVGIISRKASEADIFPVKIFDQELVSDVDTLRRAIQWCIDEEMDIVNLSLGTTEAESRTVLQEICDLAYQKNVMIVAALSNDGKESYPASFPEVFGVAAGKVRGKYSYYFDTTQPIQFIARGDRQRLDWKDNQQVFMGGTSFAAPHITAIIALLLQKYSGVTYGELCEILQSYSLPEVPPLVDGKTLYTMSDPMFIQKNSDIKLSDIYQQNKVQWIKEAVIYPFNKEMHSLIRFQDLLPFQISHVVDVIGKRTIGKDSGEVIGAKKSGLIVRKYIEDCLSSCETIILGYLDEISRIKKRDILKEMLELALKFEKNVYSLTPITQDNYPQLADEFKRKGLHLGSPIVDVSVLENITKTFSCHEKSQRPIVGVFGTSPQQGKFTTQLALRQGLQKIGYKVGQLGTEHQSALFGFDFTFPNGYDSYQNIRIPMDMHIPLLQSVMVGIERENPHIIIVGGQSGVIPYSYAEKSSVYTLPSLITLMGTVPDAYILLVNSVDEFDFIQENIDALKAIGKGETILLVFSDKKKALKTTLRHVSVVHEPLTKKEIQNFISELETHFGIPATEIVSNEGQKKMVDAVIDYFAEK